MVPVFAANRSISLAPSFAPAASPRLRRRLSPWPPHRHAKPATESTTQRWSCTAPRPISTRFEPVPRLRSFTTGSSRIPSDLARRTRTVWQCQPVPALSALLPALPGVSRVELRSAPTGLLRQPGEEDSHLLRFPAPHGAPAPRGARSPRSRHWTGPRRSCRCGPGCRRQRTHDYVRHGTTTLFAALDVATGKVTDACYPRHRNEEFLRFLKHIAKAYPRVPLHIVCDNYATHKHPTVQAWLARNPRITLHFTPTSGSWLNMVEIFFGIITRQAIRRGTLHHGQGPHRRHRDLHRRLERTLPAIHLDQERRPDTHQSRP